MLSFGRSNGSLRMTMVGAGGANDPTKSGAAILPATPILVPRQPRDRASYLMRPWTGWDLA
jgi:hypothetical protein